MTCLTEEELLASIDGGIAPNERTTLESHLASCGTCRASLQELELLVGDLAALPELDEEAHVKNVMARLGEKRPLLAKRRSPRWQIFGGALSAVAIAAGALLLLRHEPSLRDDPAFASRGAANEHTLSRDVGIRLLTGDKTLSPVTAGATVTSDAAFTGAYTNVHDKPAYVLLFAVDSKGEVHWLYPAYASSAQNPGSVALRRAEAEAVMGTSVVLDAPAPGLLRFVTVVTDQPLHVLDIEGLRAGALAKDALERAYPQAVITTLDARVVTAGKP